MVESVIKDKADEAALCIVDLCNEIEKRKREDVLSEQLLRAGTSVGMNINEAKYSESKADYLSKIQIALQECYETEYWLNLLYDTKYITDSNSYKKILKNLEI